MFDTLPSAPPEFLTWTWERIAPYYADLDARPLSADSLPVWMQDWSHLKALIDESYSRLSVAHTQDTTNQERERAYQNYLEEIYNPAMAADNRLQRRLLESGLQVPGFEQSQRRMASDVRIFHEDNLPLYAEQQKLTNAYNRILGTQTVQWGGEEVTLTALQASALTHRDRNIREEAWRLIAERQLADRDEINRIWSDVTALRQRIAANVGMDYRSYKWEELYRYDYTPEDCKRFHQAIEETVVPAATRRYEKIRSELGLSGSLRPWDLEVETKPQPPLKPFEDVETLEARGAAIFARMNPRMGGYFETLQRENLLDLPNRKGKRSGAYSASFEASQRPFIFMNAVGVNRDVFTFFHESGHAFHAFQTYSERLPYIQQRFVPMEFCEVASMALELLATPYLAEEQGGFYSEAEARRAVADNLEKMLFFWPYMAVVDAFQHWVYENHEAATHPANCDAVWSEQWDRFMVGVDYSGLEDVKATGWQRKHHITRRPFYYIEYGLAQLGAVQVFGRSRQDYAAAVQNYLDALALGGEAPLPQLYATAGARFAFDADTVGAAVDLIENVLHDIEVTA